MTKVKFFYMRCFFVIMGVSCITGCGAVVPPTITPTVFVTPSATFTPAPPYIHYTSPQESNVHLEFDYPSYWYFKEGKYPYTEGYSIFLSDPLILTAPTKDPNHSHHEPDSYGRIYIWIQPLPNNQALEGLVQEEKELVQRNINRMTLLANYTVNVDGDIAYVLEILNNAPEVHITVMFDRTIYFVVEDLFYRINFAVSVDERGGEFEKGYEYFINSLKIAP